MDSNFEFIMKHPAAIFAGGGILMLLIDKNGIGWGLIGLATILQLVWLFR